MPPSTQENRADRHDPKPVCSFAVDVIRAEHCDLLSGARCGPQTRQSEGRSARCPPLSLQEAAAQRYLGWIGLPAGRSDPQCLLGDNARNWRDGAPLAPHEHAPQKADKTAGLQWMEGGE